MGKFAQKPRPRTATVKTRALASTSAISKSAAPAKTSAILKKTTFKAKTAVQTAKVPKYAVPKTRQSATATEPDPKTIKFVVDPIPLKQDDSTVATQAETPRHIPKKEKIQNRHDKLMRKFDTALEARRTVQMKAKDAKRTTKRQQKQKITQINATKVQAVRSAIADLSSLSCALPTLDDALPSLNSLFQLKAATSALRTGVPKFDKAAARKAAAAAAKKAAANGDSEGATKRKVSKTTNTLNKKNEFMQRYNYLQKLTNDRMFKANPREVIAAHIRNRQKTDE